MSKTVDIESLFVKTRADFPEALREDGWYIAFVRRVVYTSAPSMSHIAYMYLTLQASTALALQRPELIPQLFTHLTTLPSFSTFESRRRLSARLRDTLLKSWLVVGIPVVVSSLPLLVAAERAVDPALVEPESSSLPYPSSQLSAAEVDTRGTQFIQTLYQQNLEPIFSTWGAHRPAFEWLEKSIIYGHFISDHTILSPVETELVIMPGILAQGLGAPAVWHIRGMLRLGVPREDVQAVVNSVKYITSTLGVDSAHWPGVDDVPASDLNG
jgi:hypothetical protein